MSSLMSFGKVLIFVAFPAMTTALPHDMNTLDTEPNLPSDPNTTPYCTWWFDYQESVSCQTLLESNFITDADFRRWNPSLGANCEGILVGNSYCVEAAGEPAPSTTTPKSTVTIAPTTYPPVTPTVPTAVSSTSTKPPNGITTPTPTQPNIVDNCDEFYMVEEGDGCSAIASRFGITLEQFLIWNPAAGSTCGGLWKDAYACVSIIGKEGTKPPTTSTKPSTTTSTKPTNGVVTPTPTQPNMVGNCDQFYFVVGGKDTCASIATKYAIPLASFLTWNPSAGSTCGGLWADAYACVHTIGYKPTTTTTKTQAATTTKSGNGISTPTPTQPGMVTNCKKFDYVKDGEGCDAVEKRNKVTHANFIKWNTGVGSDCKSMWAKTYVCVGV